jgi:hypothetical protein
MQYASDVDHLHHIQARQQHEEWQEESSDHIPDNDMVLLNQSQLDGAQYKDHHCVLLGSHPLMRC